MKPIENTFEHRTNNRIAENLRIRLQTACRQADLALVDLNLREISSNQKKSLVCFFIHDLINSDDGLARINAYLENTDKHLLICTDNICKGKFSRIKFLCHPALIGLNYLHTDISSYIDLQELHPKKLFNCFIHRVESVRQSWFYFLHDLGLLDHGHVSFLCFNMAQYSGLYGQDLYDYIHYHHALDRLPHFDAAYHKLRSQIPFRNFKETGKLSDKILDSKYSLVLDTYATVDQSTNWFLSEKTWRVITMPVQPLFFCQRNALTEHAKLGLEIDLVNLDLDHLDWISKQKAILDILVNDSEQPNFQRLKDRALHNFYLLRNMYEHNQTNFFAEVIDLAKSKNS